MPQWIQNRSPDEFGTTAAQRIVQKIVSRNAPKIEKSREPN